MKKLTASLYFGTVLFLSAPILSCQKRPASVADLRMAALKAIDSGDPKAALAALKDWKSIGGDKSPDYWVSWSNATLQAGTETSLQITADKGPLQGKVVELTDPTTGERAGAITEGEPTYDPVALKACNAAVDQALKLAPERLDIWTGKAHLARLAGPIGPVLKALEQMVQAATDGKPGKLVRGGEPLTEKGERYALDMVQSYTKEYFDKGTPEDLAKGREVAELTIRLFPRSPEGYNSLGGFYASRGDWKKSLPLFLKAHAIDPKDDLVTNNVSYCYLQLGSEAKARPFIEQVAQHGTDADMVAVAKRRLAGLKK